MRANTLTAVQTENILFILLSIFMNYAGIEEFLCQKCSKPLRKMLCVVQLQKQKTKAKIRIYNHTRENKFNELRDPTMFIYEYSSTLFASIYILMEKERFSNYCFGRKRRNRVWGMRGKREKKKKGGRRLQKTKTGASLLPMKEEES